jgi:hypothetical protein
MVREERRNGETEAEWYQYIILIKTEFWYVTGFHLDVGVYLSYRRRQAYSSSVLQHIGISAWPGKLFNLTCQIIVQRIIFEDSLKLKFYSFLAGRLVLATHALYFQTMLKVMLHILKSNQ